MCASWSGEYYFLPFSNSSVSSHSDLYLLTLISIPLLLSVTISSFLSHYVSVCLSVSLSLSLSRYPYHPSSASNLFLFPPTLHNLCVQIRMPPFLSSSVSDYNLLPFLFQPTIVRSPLPDPPPPPPHTHFSSAHTHTESLISDRTSLYFTSTLTPLFVPLTPVERGSCSFVAPFFPVPDTLQFSEDCVGDKPGPIGCFRDNEMGITGKIGWGSPKTNT